QGSNLNSSDPESDVLPITPQDSVSLHFQGTKLTENFIPKKFPARKYRKNFVDLSGLEPELF
ncbi:MAG TPA: hypothetical protein PLV99_08380, partial [Prolixibacteraceae bacterium]|nr:hypothetical protein [Prolixibacteraceae bacterium]